MSQAASDSNGYTIPSPSHSKPSAFIYVGIAIGGILVLFACVLLILAYYDDGQLARLLPCLSRVRRPVPLRHGHHQSHRRSINSRGFWDTVRETDDRSTRTVDLEWDLATSASSQSTSDHSSHLPGTFRDAPQPFLFDDLYRHQNYIGIPIVPHGSIELESDHQSNVRTPRPDEQPPLLSVVNADVSPSSKLSTPSLDASDSSCKFRNFSLDPKSPQTSTSTFKSIAPASFRPYRYGNAALASVTELVSSDSCSQTHEIRRTRKEKMFSFACVGEDLGASRNCPDQYPPMPQPILKKSRPSSIPGPALSLANVGKNLPFPTSSSHKVLWSKVQNATLASGPSNIMFTKSPGLNFGRISAPLASTHLTAELQERYKLTGRDTVDPNGRAVNSKTPLTPIAPITPGLGMPKLEEWPLTSAGNAIHTPEGQSNENYKHDH
ncbi:hypothetical protein FH972_024473 [Carpinus fangiana]|uniref:Uncharacterized protein n=1 Tax=Carpinus fangiana TaxID=176857 RepID=A0A5N6KY49_9ROSI|nr:hypothetical protein FH972_024473 [Carpinus fangiana]